MTKLMGKLAAVIVLCGFAGVAAAGSSEKKLTLADVPPAVRTTIEQQAAGAKVKAIHKEVEDGKTSYVAEISGKSRKFEAEVGEDGALLGTEEPVKLKNVPEAVQKTIKMQLAGRKLKELEKRVEHGTAFYEIVIVGVEGEIAIASDGTVMPSEAERDTDGKKDDK